MQTYPLHYQTEVTVIISWTDQESKAFLPTAIGQLKCSGSVKITSYRHPY